MVASIVTLAKPYDNRLVLALQLTSVVNRTLRVLIESTTHAPNATANHIACKAMFCVNKTANWMHGMASEEKLYV